MHAEKKGRLNQPGWKQFKRTAKYHGEPFTEANEAKTKQHFDEPKSKCSIEFLENFKDAVCLDEANDNAPWQDIVKVEMELMKTHKAFKDHGKDALTLDGFKNFRFHPVFNVKHDGHHHGQLVTNMHSTDVPVESDYSGVVSLRGLDYLCF